MDPIQQFTEHIQQTPADDPSKPLPPLTGGQGEGSRVDALLDSAYIDPLMELPDYSFLFRIGGIPCMPAGEIITITAKAKQGKTFACSILAAAAFCHECLGVESTSGDFYRVLWVDTEQSEKTTQDIMKRVLTMANIDVNSYSKDWFPAVNLRKFRWDERVEIVQQAILRHRPDIVIIDGSRDFVRDINDGPECSGVVNEMTRWASGIMTNLDDPDGEDILIRPMLIINVLHENKAIDDYTLRGHIGTELTNKSFEIYQCKVDDSRIFSFSQTASRVAPVKIPVQYTINGEGLPEKFVGGTDEDQEFIQRKSTQATSIKEPFKTRNGEWDLEAIFNNLFSSETTIRSLSLNQKVQHLLHIGGRLASTLIAWAVDQHIIYRNQVTPFAVYYSLKPEDKQQTFDLPEE